MELKLPYIRTWTNFWILGMAYAFFCWSIFIAYCIYYQVSRLRVYHHRNQRIHRKEDSLTAELPKFRFLNQLNYVVRIPYITELISVKQIAGTILFGIINLYFIFVVYPYEFAPYHIAIIDRRAAFIGMVDWSLVFFFAQRNSLLPKICGLTFEELMPLHRIFARIGFLTFIPHFVYRVYYAYMIQYSWFDAFFQDIEYTTGTIATVAYIVMFATSIEYIRRNHFEVFYYCHVLFLMVAIVFTCWHYPTCLAFYIPPVGLWIADRSIRFYKSWIIKSSFVSVQQVVAQTATQEGIVHISLQNKLLNHFKPGQYLFAAIVLNKHKFWEYMNWHPFTISEVFEASQEDKKSEEHSVGAEETTGLLQSKHTSYLTSSSQQRQSSECKDKIASIHIKSLGVKTQDLLAASCPDNKKSNEIQVYVDGLYGPQLPYQDFPILALFATGIGVTPAIAIIQDVIRKRCNGIRTVTSHHIYLHWAIRTLDEIDPFMNMFSQWSQQVQSAVLPVELYVKIYATRMKQQDHSVQQLPNFTLSFGDRPQVGHEMSMVKASHTQNLKTWVHVCGSVAFTRTVINEAVEAGFDVHHEVFEF